ALVVAAGSITMGLASLGLNASIKRTASGAAPDAAKGYLIYALRITSIAVAVAGVALAAGREPIGTALGIEKGSRDLLALAGLLAFGSTVEALFDSYFKARERTR